MSPLHIHHVAPLSFLVDAVEETNGSFNVTAVGRPFGKNKEAYVRTCYEELVKEIFNSREHFRKQTAPVRAAMLFVVGGSSGIGKSTFLAYFVVRLRGRFTNIAVCYAPKASKTLYGTPRTEDVICMVWKNKTKIIEGRFSEVGAKLDTELPNLDLIVMDGCSMPFVDVERFTGTVIVAAPPSLFVKNLKNAIFYRRDFIMPPIEETEANGIAEMLGVPKDVVETNFSFMRGITRYLFTTGAAKAQVDEAIEEVSASNISKMVSMQTSRRSEQLLGVHSLVLWKLGRGYKDSPSFELVSCYAEQQVAKKLVKESMEELKTARRSLAPLSGAECYAGALFEAYAIRTLQIGGEFTMRSLDTEDHSITLKLSKMDADPVVVESSILEAAVVPYDNLHVPLDSSVDMYSPRLLWPTTTDFPTFDCFYFHSNGEVLLCQMTIAKTHELKNEGASNAKNYLDGMFETKKPSKYRVVFIVPIDNAPGYKKQNFSGNVRQNPSDLAPYFDQWVIGV